MAKLIIKDEVNVKIEGLELAERKALVDKFKFDIPGARYLPAVRLGRWDGKVSFFQLGGSTYYQPTARDPTVSNRTGL